MKPILAKKWSRGNYLWLISSLFLLLAFLAGCRWFQKLQNSAIELHYDKGLYQEPSLWNQDGFFVVQSGPKGEVKELAKKSITVVFNQPVVALAKLAKNPLKAFRIEPEVAGRYKWQGSQICSFIPDRQWQAGRQYRVRVNPDLKSLEGKTLKQEHTFTFHGKIIPLRLNYTRPYNNHTIGYQPKIKLSFNYPIDLTVLKRHLSFRQNNRAIAYHLRFVKQVAASYYGQYKDEVDYQVQLQPRRRLNRGSQITIKIDGNMSSADGAHTFEQKEEIEYTTYGPLKAELEGEPQYFSNWGHRLSFNNPVDNQTVVGAVSFSPPVQFDKLHDSYNGIYLSSWQLQPGQKYQLTIRAFRDKFGNRLIGKRSFTVNIPHRRRNFYIKDRGRILEARERLAYPLDIVGLPQIRLQFGAITKQDLQKKLTQKKYRPERQLSLKSHIWQTGLERNQFDTLAVKLNKWLTTGWYYTSYSAQVDDYRKDELTEKQQGQWLQITDLGIVAKESYRAIHTYVHSLHEGTPVANARVVAYLGTKQLASCNTNQQGYCRLAKENPKLADHLILIVSKDNDKAYLTVGDDQYYSYPYGQTDIPKKQIHGAIYFDRRLYRPGDTMFFKGVLSYRQYAKVRPLAEQKVTVKIIDSQGESIYTREIISSKQGGVWGKFLIPQAASLGHYSLYLTINKKDEVMANFQVEEFRPAGFSVAVEQKDKIIAAENLPASIEAKYLFGAPMSEARVKTDVYKKNIQPAVTAYPQYEFGDEQWDSGRDLTLYMENEQHLNTRGQRTVKIPLKYNKQQQIIHEPYQKLELFTPYRIQLESKVYDIDDKSITATKSSEVYLEDLLIGIRSQDRYISSNNDFSFRVLTTDVNGSKKEVTELTARILHTSYQQSISKNVDGEYEKTYTKKIKEVKIYKFSTIAGSKDLLYHPDEPGDYSLLVQSKQGSYARIRFYVFQTDSYWDNVSQEEVEIELDKQEYRPGQKARVIIKSPIGNAKAIVSVERHTILWQKVYSFKSNVLAIELPIQKEYLPNVYISVAIIRRRVQPPPQLSAKQKQVFQQTDMGIPRFLQAYRKVHVNISSKIIPLTITTDKQKYAPGETVKIAIQSSPNAEVLIAVADRAVLDLLNYRYQNPVKTFYSNWQHGIRVLENRNAIIKQILYKESKDPGAEEGGEGGGSGGLGGFDRDSDDGKRKNFKFTALWRPNVQTDTDGKAEIDFTLPDNLTTFRIMALAMKDSHYGSKNHEFQVQKTIVARKVLPNFIRPGDHLQAGVLLTNQSEQDISFTVSMQADLLTIGNQRQQILLKAGTTEEVNFQIRLNQQKYWLKKAASTKVVFQAIPEAGNGLDRKQFREILETKLAIRENAVEEAFAISGYTTTTAKQAIQLPPIATVLRGSEKLNLSLSTTALTGLKSAYRFYRSNPYFCLEQRASAYLLAISSGQLLQRFSFSPPDDKSFDFQNIEKIFIDELGQFQSKNGGLRLWKNSAKPSPYLTAYVSFILQMAQNKGHRIDKEVLDSALSYLREYIKKPPADGFSYVLETLSLINYVLTYSDQGSEGLNQFLLQNQKNLSLRARANLALSTAMLNDLKDYRKDSRLKKLFTSIYNAMQIEGGRVLLQEKPRSSYYRAFYSDAATTGVVLRAMMALDSKNPLITKMIVAILEYHRVYFADSHSSGILALALHDYYSLYEKDNDIKEISAKITLANRTILTKSLPTSQLGIYRKTLSLANWSDLQRGKTYPLRFTNPQKKGRLYYTASFSYSPQAKKLKARSEGLQVERGIYRIKAAGNKKILQKMNNGFQRGQTYLVKLKIISPMPRFHVLITDPLPSHFEIVNSEFAGESSLQDDLVSARKQDSYWWSNSQALIEYRQENVVITEEFLPAGIKEYSYLIRPLLKGRAEKPPMQAKLMYEPQIFARTENSQITVE